MCKTSSYITGIVTGMAVGAVLLCTMSTKTNKNKCKRVIKAKAGRAVNKISDFIDDMM